MRVTSNPVPGCDGERSGQLDGGTGLIVTLWLLTSETDEADAWGDTQVGQDWFWPAGTARPASPRGTSVAHP